jgi:hypothetical protein
MGRGTAVKATHVVPAGRYALRVQAPQCVEFTDTLNVAPDTPVEVRGRLICETFEER